MKKHVLDRTNSSYHFHCRIVGTHFWIIEKWSYILTTCCVAWEQVNCLYSKLIRHDSILMREETRVPGGNPSTRRKPECPEKTREPGENPWNQAEIYWNSTHIRNICSRGKPRGRDWWLLRPALLPAKDGHPSSYHPAQRALTSLNRG